MDQEYLYLLMEYYYVVDNSKMDFYMELVDCKTKLVIYIQVILRMVNIMVEEFTYQKKMDLSGLKEFGKQEI